MRLVIRIRNVLASVIPLIENPMLEELLNLLINLDME